MSNIDKYHNNSTQIIFLNENYRIKIKTLNLKRSSEICVHCKHLQISLLTTNNVLNKKKENT